MDRIHTLASLNPFEYRQPFDVTIQSELRLAVKFESMVTILSVPQFSTEIKCNLYPSYSFRNIWCIKSSEFISIPENVYSVIYTVYNIKTHTSQTVVHVCTWKN